MRYMAERIPIWPPISELLRSRHKYNVICNLDDIARGITNTSRPQTALLSENHSIDGCVLKREGSDFGNHFYGPEKTCKLTSSRIQEMANEEPFRWMKQRFVPALKRIGEWRVIIVGSRILYIVNTVNGPDRFIASKLRMAGYTLEEMA